MIIQHFLFKILAIAKKIVVIGKKRNRSFGSPPTSDISGDLSLLISHEDEDDESEEDTLII